MTLQRPDDLEGGLAAVLAHPDDESFSCAGAMALAHDAGRPVRLLVATRGEAGAPEGADPAGFAEVREDELRCAASKIGFTEVTVLEGYPDGGVADMPFAQLVDDIAGWLALRRPNAVITFGAHGVTGHPDHVVVGSATRWAVERLAETGQAPHAIYIITPVFGAAARGFDLSAEEGAATHRIDVTSVAARKIAALRCHASQPDAQQEAVEVQAGLDRDGVVYEGFNRVRPPVPAPHPKFDTRLV